MSTYDFRQANVVVENWVLRRCKIGKVMPKPRVPGTLEKAAEEYQKLIQWNAMSDWQRYGQNFHHSQAKR